MIYLSVLLTIPTVISISLNCYLNAAVTLQSNAVLRRNLTLESCQCFFIQQNTSYFQYDQNVNSCYTFNNNLLQAILQIQLNSRVCFINNTSTLYPVNIPVATSLSTSPISISTNVTGNNYYQQETIQLINSILLTTLLVVVNVPKTFGLSIPTSYTTFWSKAVINNITNMSTSLIYSFQLIGQNTIVPGTWDISVAFNLNGSGARPTSNDTYSIQVDSYPEIYGHF
ncbi:unnamed protein product [Rotaria magnacalcarata]|uniref:Uncharacterized protein n=2 Tax=Rotaria magnacalcarata TaxID=392030 RepID=A0A816NPB2_9BILA|nr:unnamed protein product [Rotaria magnacalcarata]CAF1418324.1 unnamed protein product [Rotaria magnacalcarata]CAF2034256.1 unnamed protein product [Rotaria magnacalcarata]CAF2037729.1 unnamed protein product [Rotaria magnacalcarata]